MVNLPPIFELVCPLFPPGDCLAAVVAASEVRLAWLEGEMSGVALGAILPSWGHSRTLKIEHPWLLLMARLEGRDEHSWAQMIMHVQAAVYISVFRNT